MPSNWLRRWGGVLILLELCLASVVYGATGKLVLFVNPRYVPLTIAVGVLGALASMGVLIAGGVQAHHHQHDHHDHARTPHKRRSDDLWAGLLVIATVVFLVLPPVALTPRMVSQRSLNAGFGQASGEVGTSVLSRASAVNSSALSVKDWANLLQQTSDPAFYASKSADVTGFVSADPAGNPDVLYLTRYVVTCCLADAQPVGVPVAAKSWRSTYTEGQWLHAQGRFTASSGSLALAPTTLWAVKAPDAPYLA